VGLLGRARPVRRPQDGLRQSGPRFGLEGRGVPRRIDKSYPGYLNQHDTSAPGAKIYFTAQPLFFDLTTQWAETLQKMVAKEVPVDEGLDQLAASVDKQLKDAGLGG
jgi:ABC-type glycerol-3-phosphate transport system substrate-binding protein